MRVIWPASHRYGLEPAPGGLGFVHDLLNTSSMGRPRQPDLLLDPESAQGWADAALAAWSATTGQPAQPVVLDEAGLAELSGFRDELRAGLNRQTTPEQIAVPALHTAAAALRLGEDGRVRLEPRGTGWRYLASLTLAAILHAQGADTWRRLKACRNPRCQAAFFDRSRNNIGVWHDVHVCGNAANLRAYRARQRGAATEPADH